MQRADSKVTAASSLKREWMQRAHTKVTAASSLKRECSKLTQKIMERAQSSKPIGRGFVLFRKIYTVSFSKLWVNLEPALCQEYLQDYGLSPEWGGWSGMGLAAACWCLKILLMRLLVNLFSSSSFCPATVSTSYLNQQQQQVYRHSCTKDRVDCVKSEIN